MLIMLLQNTLQRIFPIVQSLPRLIILSASGTQISQQEKQHLKQSYIPCFRVRILSFPYKERIRMFVDFRAIFGFSLRETKKIIDSKPIMIDIPTQFAHKISSYLDELKQRGISARIE